jgi:hypothetical protein
MGNDYYEVTVEDVRGSRVVLRVTSLDSNAAPPFETESFAMSLLVDLWQSLVNGWLLAGSGASVDEAKTLALSPPVATVMARLEALAHGVPPDPDGFGAAAAPLVASVVHDEHEHQDTYELLQRYVDPENPIDFDGILPKVRITVGVTDATLLGFVRTGMRFHSRAYF